MKFKCDVCGGDEFRIYVTGSTSYWTEDGSYPFDSLTEFNVVPLYWLECLNYSHLNGYCSKRWGPTVSLAELEKVAFDAGVLR